MNAQLLEKGQCGGPAASGRMRQLHAGVQLLQEEGEWAGGEESAVDGRAHLQALLQQRQTLRRPSARAHAAQPRAACCRPRFCPPTRPGPPLCATPSKAPKKKVGAAPLASAKKAVKKETNPLYEKRAKNFGAE
jgi:hypothetical protein